MSEYAHSFVQSRLTETCLPALTKDTLKTDLHIDVLGDILAILSIAKPMLLQQIPQLLPLQPPTVDNPIAKPHMIKPPTIAAEMSLPQFRKFKTDWQIYKQSTGILAPLLQGNCTMLARTPSKLV